MLAAPSWSDEVSSSRRAWRAGMRLAGGWLAMLLLAGAALAQSGGGGERRPRGSAYVPLDSWIYAAFDRLGALGYAPAGFAGLRPWTRAECARLAAEAGRRLQSEEEPAGEAVRLHRAVAAEFSEEGGGLRLESVYSRFTGVAGTPLRDGYHFAQTIINDYGRPYGEGGNVISGVSARAEAGSFAFYLRGEFQHWPGSPPDSPQVMAAVAQADSRPPFGSPSGGADRFRLLDTYGVFNFRDTQISFGKQSLWLGPGQGGPFLFSNNAEPIWMAQLNRVSPWRLPGVSAVLGPLRWQFFLGQLAGQHFVYSAPTLYEPEIDPQPFIHGEKVSFQPTENFEFGMGVSTLLGGPGMPFTWHNFWRSFAGSNAPPGTAGDGGDRRSSFDFSYRVPGLRRWLTFYSEAVVEDEISPLGSSRPALHPGIYLPQLPGIPRLDLRLEGVYSDIPGVAWRGQMYFNGRYRSGYTNQGNLLASWIGRQGLGGQAWATYWFAPRRRLQLSWRHMEVDRAFLQGGHLNDFALSGELQMGTQWTLAAGAQYERWAFPLLAPRPQSNAAISLQLTFRPGLAASD